MGLSRSTFYATLQENPSDADLVAEIRAIGDEFECYGYRRVGAELRHRGLVVNAKKVRRLMREHDLNPRRRRRFTRTTDSVHDGPIFPFVARNFEVHGPDQLWVADLAYVAIGGGSLRPHAFQFPTCTKGARGDPSAGRCQAKCVPHS
jgi:putative transposase